MSKYNHYAKEMNAQFIKARDGYRYFFEKYAKAVSDFENAQRFKPDVSREEREDDISRTKSAYLKAKQAFEQANPMIWGEYIKSYKNLREGLKRDLEASRNVDPGAIDVNALELLKSGIMGVSDYKAMAEKFAGNVTMLRMIRKYAEDHEETAETREERYAMYEVLDACTDEATAKLASFDDIYYCSRTFGKFDHDNMAVPKRFYDLSVSMAEKWDEFTELQQAIEDF